MTNQNKKRQSIQYPIGSFMYRIQKLLQEAFNAGSARAISSHKDFKQIHPNFNDWFEFVRKEIEELMNPSSREKYNYLADYIRRQIEWSETTFGPGERTHGIIQHITDELSEIRNAPDDLMEWIDVIILALDGAWRSGWTPEMIVCALDKKQNINFKRKWPNWRKFTNGEAIHHIRKQEEK